MDRAYFVFCGGLLAIDLAANARRLRQPGRGAVLSYLLLAYVPLLVVPWLGARLLTVLAASVALLGFVSYARMVGLTQARGWTLPSIVWIAAFFVVTQLHWYGLFQAMPVFALFALLALAAARGKAHAFLQTLCLSWLGVLVYGYFWSHAALFDASSLALILLMAKTADVGWTLGQQLRPSFAMQALVSPLAAMGAALLIWHARWLPLSCGQSLFLGLCVGGGIALASHAFKLILADVSGSASERPAKGTQIFAFGFAVALAYHWLRYLS